MVDLDDLKARFVGREFDSTEVVVKPEDALTFARCCGETDPRYSDPDHPEYQAPPTFTSRFVGRRAMPEEFPGDVFQRAFDGGKLVIAHAPVPVGEPLVASSQIADVFRKTGRSGAMTFIVHRMEFRDRAGTLLSTVDWKLIQKDGPEGA
jgi:hypothetical protein